MIFELRKVHYSPSLSEETPAYTADIWINGKNAGSVRNSGTGGDTLVQLHRLSGDAVKTIFDWVSKQPPHVYPAVGENESFSVPLTLDVVVDNLFEEWHEAKYSEAAQHKRWIRNAVVFRLPNDAQGEYRTIKFPKGCKYNKQLRDHVIAKHGPDVEILNDRYTPLPV